MKKTILYISAAVLTLFVGSVCFGNTDDVVTVPISYPTIQTAIDGVAGGGVVVVMPGTYLGPGNCDIDFNGKNVILFAMSPGAPHDTIIDCANQGRAFYFHSGETSASKVFGFTIRNCSPAESPYSGGAILCTNNSMPRVFNCIIENSEAEYGGGIALDSSGATLKNCLIKGNNASEDGGAVYAGQNSNPNIVNCTITGNTAFGEAGISSDETSNPAIVNTTIVNNTSQNSEKDILSAVSYSCMKENVQAEGVSNIEADPVFEIGASGDYYLKVSSPLIDAGKAPMRVYGTTSVNGTGDAGVMDIGFHYKATTLAATPVITNIVPAEGAETTNRRQPFGAGISNDVNLKRAVLLLDNIAALDQALSSQTAQINFTPAVSMTYGQHTYHLSVWDVNDNVLIVVRNFEVHSSCFLAGTSILMPDNTTRPIENIKVGDIILAFDEETKSFKPDTVTHVFAIPDEPEYLVINDDIKVTPAHCFYTTKGEWKEAGQLSIFDNLYDAKGLPKEITSIELVKEKVTVYNLEVNPYHTFVANGVVVHNAEVVQRISSDGKLVYVLEKHQEKLKPSVKDDELLLKKYPFEVEIP